MISSLPWFPAVGALLGGILFGLWRLLDAIGLGDWPEGIASALVIAAAILTRGLHLDGLADAADGLFSMSGKARTLEIMKDSRIGTFGVLALVMILGLKWVALNRLVESGLVIWLIPAFTVSRAALVELAVCLPYAGAEGGTGAPFVNGAGARHRIIGWLVAVLLAAAVTPLALGALILGYLVVKILGGFYMRRTGGVTGDLLGAACEAIETSILVVAALSTRCLTASMGWEGLPW